MALLSWAKLVLTFSSDFLKIFADLPIVAIDDLMRMRVFKTFYSPPIGEKQRVLLLLASAYRQETPPDRDLNQARVMYFLSTE
jgi:hypothetical protein